MLDWMLKNLATEMLLTVPTVSSASGSEFFVIEADFADLQTFARWCSLWQFEQVLPQALHFSFLSSGELVWLCFCSPQ